MLSPFGKNVFESTHHPAINGFTWIISVLACLQNGSIPHTHQNAFDLTFITIWWLMSAPQSCFYQIPNTANTMPNGIRFCFCTCFMLWVISIESNISLSVFLFTVKSQWLQNVAWKQTDEKWCNLNVNQICLCFFSHFLRIHIIHELRLFFSRSPICVRSSAISFLRFAITLAFRVGSFVENSF